MEESYLTVHFFERELRTYYSLVYLSLQGRKIGRNGSGVYTHSGIILEVEVDQVVCLRRYTRKGPFCPGRG